MKRRAGKLRERLHSTRRWIFRWRGLDGSPLRGLLALMIAGGIFGLAGTGLRLRVSAPQQWVERKASVIHLPTDGMGREWALRARAEGPWPARFDVNAWEKSYGVADALIGSTRLSTGHYEPKLKELPAREGVLPVELADKDERVFPHHEGAESSVADPVRSVPAPVLYPRSGITEEEMPAILPAFDAGGLDVAALSSAPRVFLLELDAAGRVRASTDLSGDGDIPAIREWLAKVGFGPDVAAKSPILAVAVGFTNVASTDGPDAR